MNLPFVHFASALLASFFLTLGASSQCTDNALVMTSNQPGYGVTLELDSAHVNGELAGYSTYRLYLTTLHADDVVSSVVGDNEFPLSLSTTGTFFQEPIFGGPTPEMITPMALELWPALAFDSWVTLGIDGPASVGNGEVNISLLPGTWVDEFENGNGFLVDSPEGSGWYTLPPNSANGLAGSDRKVLIAQLTTNGHLSGSLRTQIFLHGNLDTDVRVDLTFDSQLPEDAVCGCTDESANNYDPLATADDGSCEFDIAGCLISFACNYDPNATQDDGSCEFESCIAFGCTDPSACNFDPEADFDDGGCVYPNFPYDCDGNCFNDGDGDGLCDEFEVFGCTDPEACNYQAGATDDDDSCTYDCLGCTNSAACNYDDEALLDDGSCEFTSCFAVGCTDPEGCNYDPEAEFDDGSCAGIPEGDCDCNGNQLDALGVCGGDCQADENGNGICDNAEQAGCTSPLACNFNPEATTEDGSCDFLSCIAFGCTDPSACNFDPEADFDDGGCVYPNFPYDCDGNCFNDGDGDGLCDEFEVFGCTDPEACNYQAGATDDDDSCTYDCLGCTNSAACNYDDEALLDDGSCEFTSCFAVGCIDPEACNYDPEAEFEDGSCFFPDACGICEGPGAIYECGCFDVPSGDCDCNGNQLDALGVCGGDCEADENGNGICDNVEQAGCTSPLACNYDPEATTEDGSCDFLSCIAFGCTDPSACNYDPEADYDDGGCVYPNFPYDCDGNCFNDGDGDGLCDEFEVFGCTDPEACNYQAGATDDDDTCTYDCLGCTNSAACNYDPEALLDDGSCEFTSCVAVGCTDPEACNYDPEAEFDDGSCAGIPEGGCDCNGNQLDALGVCGGDCQADENGNGICDNAEQAGCTSPLACNFNPEATTEDGSCDFLSCIAFGCTDPSACNFDPEADFDDGGCVYPNFPYDCDGNCFNDGDGDGLCDEFEVFGCTDPEACNYQAGATDDDDSCTYDCLGCTNSAACNYDDEALLDDGSCEFTSCFAVGCTDPEACNYDPEAEFEDGSCFYPDACGICEGPGAIYECGCFDVPSGDCDCNGNQLDALEVCGGDCEADENGNGICDVNEIAGCTDPSALNYNSAATLDDGTCVPIIPGCINPSACNYNPEATVSNGSCDYESCVGCTNLAACNYNPDATISANATCTFPEADNVDCNGNCLFDADDDGICDEEEVSGCTDPAATNFDPNATEDDGSCVSAVPGCTNAFACNYNSSANVNDGTCDFDSCVGCTNPDACNYDPDATIPANNTCTEPIEDYLDCEGQCLFDSDGDGVCDELEILGCTDPDAFNYESDATDDDGSCVDVIGGCLAPNACNYNASANVSDGSCEYESCVGCTLEGACNYDPNATISANGTCTYPEESNLDCEGNCLSDSDNDGVCDEDELGGCTDPEAFNFDSNATDDDGSCIAVVPGCLQSNACNFDPEANVSDGSCEFSSCAGCTLEDACNYDATATIQDNGTCEFPEEDYLSCDGSCLNDSDGDDVCDELEVLGCTNPEAQNFNPNATEDNGNCIVLLGGCLIPIACNYDPSADYDYNIPSECDFDSCSGCTVPVACNYDPSASVPANSTCIFAPQFYDCDGNCNQDFDGDGVCNQLEVDGCTDSSASNYDVEATDDDGSCTYLVGGCTLPFACNYDPSVDYYLPGSCDFSCLGQMSMLEACNDLLACNFGADEPCVYFDANGDLCVTFGCTDPVACNFDEAAMLPDGSCDYDTCVGCMDPEACNYNPEALTDDGSCEYETCAGCTDVLAINFDETASLDDGSCILPGCTIAGACNYDENAGFNDGSCDFLSCAGCTLLGACNYNPDASISNNSLCTYPVEAYLNCDGSCANDSDGDGVCDELEVAGCTDPEAFNYDSDATDDDGSCEATVAGCLASAACNYNPIANVGDGSCEYVSCAGCTLPDACNFDPEATIAVNSTCTSPAEDYLDCSGACLNDLDEDGICDEIEVLGCTNEAALNYDEDATDNDGSCVTAVFGCLNPGACNYNASANVSDGSCEFESCVGCMLEGACNFDASATIPANGTCTYPTEDYLDCNGQCLQDSDGDGTCDEAEVSGCTQPDALNFDLDATEDDGSCISPLPGCLNPGACNYNAEANTSNGSCEFETCAGCLLEEACNYDPNATIAANSECTYPTEIYLNCAGDCLADADLDGVCDEEEILGCTDSNALNFDADATENDGSCIEEIQGCLNPNACNYDPEANTSNGTCDYESCIGCMIESACNFSADYTVSANSTCTYPATPYVDCEGVCLNDIDSDGVCDEIDDCVGVLDACGVCNGPGEIYECGCSDIPEGDCDCDGNQLDALGVCGGDCAADADEDGICDDVDNCVGAYDACGVCNGPGEIYECGCSDIPEGDCDCDGNQLDALGVCGGACAADADADGICDDVDDCVGALDACGICNGPGAVYECGCSDIPEGDCDCDGNQLDALGVCGGECAADADADGICDDVDDCVGALDACGVCNGPGEVYECGCADIPEGDCDCDGNQLDALGVCGGACAADADADGICDDVDDCVGALDACGICNGPGAVYECGCSDIPEGDCDCDGNQLDALGVCGGDCAADADADGICDDVDDCVGAYDACGVCNGPGEIYECGCADIPEGDCDCDGNQLDALGVCGGACAADADADGICDDVDDCVGAYDACGVCNGPGEIYECGCADIPEGDCDCDGNQLDALGVCGGACAADADADGICDDVDDCVGALDACGVCNGPGEIYECGCSDIPAGDCDCDGNQLDALGVCGGDCAADADEDGICDDVDDCVGAYDACGVCNGPGEIYECGCADIPEGDCDCDGNQLDALGVCGGDCAADADEDGICDDVDDCVGAYDACGVCNGPGEIYECGCADIPEGDCDCDGNQLDALGVCGGDCAADADEDGICDDVDDCVGAYDACGVCNGPGEIYECGCADIPEGDCDCDGNQLDALGVCGGDCAADADEDGICDDVDDCVGAYDACGVCNGPGEIYECGCADIPEGDCDCDGNQLDALGVCGGACAADADADGICDDVDVCVGALDACGVCNGPGEIYECGCSDIPAGDCDCDGNQLDALGVCGGACAADADADGICDDVDDCVGALDACGVCNGPGEVYECGCSDIPEGDCDCDGNQLDALGVCGGACAADADADGICDDVDDCVGALDACGVCNGPGEIYACGCSDIPAGDCDCDGNQLDALGVCGGDCAADADADGICDDVDNCVGAYDACGVCNGPGEIYECGCADIPEGDCDCDGNQLDALGVCGGACAADANGNGICDDEEQGAGCTDVWACNYDSTALEDDGSCEYETCLGCIYGTAANYDAQATLDDGSCLFMGCTDDDYASYNPQANEEEIGACTNTPASADFNQDGLVQLEDLVMFLQSYRLAGPEWGGLDWIQNACNVPSYTEEELWDALLDSLGFMPNLEDPAVGCSYPGALNYSPDATLDLGLCLFAGCTDPAAFNFNALATVDNGGCNYEVCPDFNGNGEVQISDLMDFLLLWGN